MNIGIITFHRAVNYGAVLQAYALCRAIRELGFDCEIIDYRSLFIEEYYDFKCLLKPKNWKRLISYILYNGNLFPDKDRFTAFLRDNHVLSKTRYSHDSLTETNQIYDCFITGSDQVWNYAAAGFDKSYFLDFVLQEEKKNSYAASFGFETIPQALEDTYRNLLRSFSHISVREETGKKIVQSLVDKDVTVDLDPTLLLTADMWHEAAAGTEKTELTKKNDYVLLYMIGEDKNIIRIARRIAKDKKTDVLYITDRWRDHIGITNLRKVSVNAWLELINGAKYVITNSFHGTVFSILFNKQFAVIQNKKLQNKSSRIQTLLSALQLQERYAYSEESALAVIGSGIDYDAVNKRLHEKRAESIADLKREILREELS